MTNYTFIIGYGYVEDSRNTSAIVNFFTNEKEPLKAVTEFINALRAVADRGEIREFLYNYFTTTADQLGCCGVFDDVPAVDWWGTITDGPIVRLWGFNHFFDDPEEDSYHLNRCIFETIGQDSYSLDKEQIYKDTYGTEVTEEVVEEVICEADRMFPDSMTMTYVISQKNDRFEVTMEAPSGMKIHLDKTFSLEQSFEIEEWIKKHVAKSSINVT